MHRSLPAVLLAALAIATSCGGGPSESPKQATPAPQPASATASGGPRVYVSDETGGRVVIVDPVSGIVVTALAVGKRPRGLHVLGNGEGVLVALSGSPIAGPGVDESKLPPADRKADGIGVVDLASRKLLRTLPSGQDPETFDLSPDGKTLFVSNEIGRAHV